MHGHYHPTQNEKKKYSPGIVDHNIYNIKKIQVTNIKTSILICMGLQLYFFQNWAFSPHHGKVNNNSSRRVLSEQKFYTYSKTKHTKKPDSQVSHHVRVFLSNLHM